MGNCKFDALRRGQGSGANTVMLAFAASVCLGVTGAARAQVAENVLYNFPYSAFPDGTGSEFPLLADAAGGTGSVRALYGVTAYGGAYGCPEGAITPGCGTVFELTAPKNGETAWGYSSLWQFTGGSDGRNPNSPLAAQTKHISRKTALYGTTSIGNGTVYSVVDGKFTTIYSFTGGADGGVPSTSNIITDGTGSLYLALQIGGSEDPFGGCGTVDKLTPPAPGQTAWTETTIWTFAEFTTDNNCGPTGLVMDSAGALYGVSQYGNSAGGYNGTVFKLSPPTNVGSAWHEETLYDFTPSQSVSYVQMSNLTIAKDGALYGTTGYAGSNDYGWVFAIVPPQRPPGMDGTNPLELHGGS